MTTRWRAHWLRARHLRQRMGMRAAPRRYAEYKPTGWSEMRRQIRERRHRNAVFTRGQLTTSPPAGDTFVGWRARWLGNRDIGLSAGAEGTVTDFAPVNDNGRRCYRIAFDNEGPVIYTYLPAPWDVELIPAGR